MEKGILFVRVSTRGQAEHGFSLDAQKKLCKEYAEQEGIELVKIYSAEGETAFKGEKRHIFNLVSVISKSTNPISSLILLQMMSKSREMFLFCWFNEIFSSKLCRLPDFSV